jgi:hypothetical protein
MIEIDKSGTRFEPKRAMELARELNGEQARHPDDSDVWTFTVRHDPTGNGYSIIDVFDSDGYKLGEM